MLCAVGNDRILRTLSGFVALKKEIEKAVLLAACTPGRLPQRAAQPTVTLARASAQPLAVARAQHRTTGRLLTAGKHTHVGTQLSRQCPGRDDIHAGNRAQMAHQFKSMLAASVWSRRRSSPRQTKDPPAARVPAA